MLDTPREVIQDWCGEPSYHQAVVTCAPGMTQKIEASFACVSLLHVVEFWVGTGNFPWLLAGRSSIQSWLLRDVLNSVNTS